ncbi:MAG: ZIP family metal transporter [Candidatus Staskawiczbacteria bacterium]|nr:ZIP family metal transporter [Candidatus Staskawiczbacteria bacterium]
MNFIPIIFSVLTFVSTFAGGIFAIKNKSKMHYIMAFAAGVLLGVVSFDIFPEIISQIKTYNFNSIEVMIALVFGFLLFHVLEKSILIQHCHEEDCVAHKHPQVGVISALALAGHSFMDGVGIGLGFQVAPAVGILVAIAVISHDFTDGMNTITLMLSNRNTDKKSTLFLFLDALAPVLGAASTLFFTVTPHFLVLYLGFFAGFLLYIGASDILPEAHSEQSSYKLMFLTILGTLLIFAITRFI